MRYSRFMRLIKLVFILVLFSINNSFADYQIKSEDVRVDSSSYEGNLSPTDNTVQKALDKFDSLIIPTGVYPAAGIAISTGSAWGTSITDNHSNWDTAYGWGNHANAGYLTNASSLDPSKVSQTSSYRFVTDTEKSTWGGKQDALGYTAESTTNKITSISNLSTDTQYPSAKLVYDQLAGKQPTGSYLTGVTVDSPLSGAGTSASHLTVDLSSKQAASSALTSIAGLTWASGSPLVKMTAAGTFELDTNTYLTSYTLDGAHLDAVFTGASGLLKKTGTATYTLDTNSYLTSVTAHNLLSAIHGDTLADTAARGDILIGNSTPKWARLPFPATPTGKIIQATATDVDWSSYPLTIGAGASVSGSNTGDQTLSSLGAQAQLNGTGFVKATGTSISYDNSTYLTSLSGAVLTSQATGQTIGDTDHRLTKLWATDITATNAISGSVTGNAGTVSNATLTTALTNNGGIGTLTWPATGATLTIPTGGGTLGSAAFTASTAYDIAGAAAAVTPASLGLVIGTNTQAYNTNLTSIANLANASGWLHNNGSGTFAYSTPTYSDVGALASGGTAADSSKLNGQSASYYQTAFGSQTANYVYAAPNGSAGTPGFRALVSTDIPALSYQSVLTNSAGLAGALSDETGTAGYAVFSAGPTFTGNVVMGTTPGANYTYTPLNLVNTGTSGQIKDQLTLVNTAGGTGTGSGVAFVTYTDAGNGVPGVEIAGIDDGKYSGSVVINTKAQGSPGNGALSEKFKFSSLGNQTITTLSNTNASISTLANYPLVLLSKDVVAGRGLGIAFVRDSGVTNPGASINYTKLGTGDYGDLSFATSPSGGVNTERMRIDSSGNVGIGTTAPESLLEIQGVEATDAVLTLDADEGDDVADTWAIESEAATNNLTFTNGTTEVSTLSSSGSLQLDGDLTVSGGDITLGTSAILSGGDTTSLNLIDAVDATTESTLESALDIGGDVTSTGMASTVIASDAVHDTMIDWGTGASQVSPADFANEDIGDITITAGAWAVEDDSHAHTSSTISGLSLFNDVTDFPADPNADKVLGWDDSEGKFIFTDAGSADITSVGDVTTGAAFDGTQGTTLTFNNAGGNATLAYDGTDYDLSKPVTVAGAVTSSGTFDVTGATGLTIGSADVTGITLTTDGTGNAELTLPADSIGDADIDWGTGAGQVSGVDISLADCGAITTSGSNDITAGGDLIATGSDVTVGLAGVKLTGDGDGALTLLGLGNGYDEDLTINLDDTENTAVLSSSTGVNKMSFGSIVIDGTGVTQTAGNNSTSLATTAYVDGKVYSRSFVITNPTATADGPVWRAPYAITITSISVLCMDGTSITGQMWEYDANGANGATIETDDIVASAGTNSTITSIDNPSIDYGNYVGWKTTSISGVPTKVIVTFDYTI